MLLQFLEPLFTKLPVRNPRAWEVIPIWNSHPEFPPLMFHGWQRACFLITTSFAQE